MRAMLILTTMLLGAPVLSGSAHADPASETSHWLTDLHPLANHIMSLGESLLRCSDRPTLLLALDRSLMNLDIASCAREGLLANLSYQVDSRDLQRLQAEAVADLGATVSDRWRAEVRVAAAAMTALTVRGLQHPTFVRTAQEFLAGDAPELHTLLADRRERPLPQREALLQYFRGLLAMAALATACEHDEHVPDVLAAVLVPLWQTSLDQLDLLLNRGSFDATDDEHPLESTPLSDVMLRFHCREPARIAELLDHDPSLTALLHELHHQVSAYFPASAIDSIALSTTCSLDAEAEATGLLAEIYTAQEVDEAEAALKRLDLEWWLDRSLRVSTPITLDVRFV